MSSRTALIDSFHTFGDLLKYLRVHAQLTQRDLSIAVGYSEAQISRQESNKRIPSEYVLKALFVPALGLEDEPEVVARMLALADKAREIEHTLVATVAEEEATQQSPAQPVYHNLPRQISSFIGREKEIEQVVSLVRQHPLVTLTGAGGVGKTRLALHAANELIHDFSDGVWLVELAPVIDPVFVPITVASVLKVHSASGQRLVQTLREYLASKNMLLILDNCEHVIDAAADLSTSLLEGCPNLSILTTSREILNVEGEFFFRCPSLSLPEFYPEHASTPDLRRVEASEAVRLFIERASAASPGFHLTERNAATIAGICQQLDGIPLAIELLAARLRLLSLDQIAGSMGDEFGLLSGSRRSAQPRHKTLRALIEWSYHMLSPAEQVLLRRLSVFSEGWSLPAAKAVVVGEGVEQAEVLNRMQQLVDKSLIFVESTEFGENRYHMLETIRQYLVEKVHEAGEWSAICDRHLAFFVQLAEQGSPPDSDPAMRFQWVQGLMRELDNVRLALNRALETNIELGLRLGIALYGVVPYELLLEFGNWLERLLEAEAAEWARQGSHPREINSSFLRGQALLCAGESSYLWGMMSQSERALVESIAIFESIGEPANFMRAAGQMQLGTLLVCTDPDQSRIYLETSREAIIKMGERFHLPDFDRKLVALNLFTSDLNRARQFAEEDLQISREMKRRTAESLQWRGEVAFYMGDFDQAIVYHQQAREESYGLKIFGIASYQPYLIGCVVLAQGNSAPVQRLSEEMLFHGRHTGNASWFLHADALLALLEWTQGANAQVEQQCEEALSKYQAQFLCYSVPFYYVIGRLSLARGNLAKAEHCFRQVDRMATTPVLRWRAYSLHAFGLLAVAQSRQVPKMAERAATLFGAQEKLFTWLPTIFSPFERDEYARALTRVREVLGEVAFMTAWGKGQAMSHKETFTLALGETGEDDH